MPTEPQRESEKRLSSYAKRRRRDAASLGEMPPAMRRTLQSEVSKVFREGLESPEWMDRMQALWPRFAIAFSVIACALIGAVFWQINEMNSSGRRDLARANTSKREFPAGGAVGAAPSRGMDKAASQSEVSSIKPSMPNVRPEDRSPLARGVARRIELADGETSSTAIARTMPLSDSPPELAPSDSADRESTLPQAEPETFAKNAPMPVTLEKAEARPETSAASLQTVPADIRALEFDSTRLASAATPATPAEAQADAQTSFRSAGALEEDGSAITGVVSLEFTQLDPASRYRKNLNSPPFPDVLRRFEARIQGTAVRIVDRDGSVYEGSILSTGNARFRAVGQNRGLNQEIVFTGSFINSPGLTNALTAESSRRGQAPEPVADTPEREPRAAMPSLSNNQRIEGTVRIGGSNAFHIEAVRTKP